MDDKLAIFLALFIIAVGGAFLIATLGSTPMQVTAPVTIGAMKVSHDPSILKNWDSVDQRVEVNQTAVGLSTNDYDLGYGLIQIAAVGGVVKDVEVSVVPKSGNFKIELYSPAPGIQDLVANGEPFSIREGEVIPIQYYVTMKAGTWTDGSYYIGVSVSAPEGTGCSDVVAEEEGGVCSYTGQVEVYVYS